MNTIKEIKTHLVEKKKKRDKRMTKYVTNVNKCRKISSVIKKVHN